MSCSVRCIVPPGTALKTTPVPAVKGLCLSRQRHVRCHAKMITDDCRSSLHLVSGSTLWYKAFVAPSPAGTRVSASAHMPALELAAAFPILVASMLLLSAEPSVSAELHQSGASPLYDVAENQEFWGNVARYGRYFITVMLGTGYVMLRPLAGMFKNPLTAILAIAGVVGAVVGTKLTLEAMLGVSQPFDYVPGSVVGL